MSADTRTTAGRDDPRRRPSRVTLGVDDRRRPRSRVALAVDDPRDLPGDFAHRRAIDVRLADTDAFGHVNNAVYLTYCEAARTSYWHAATGALFAVPDATIRTSLILADSRIAFRSPAFFGEWLTAETRVTRIGRTSLDMDHRLTGPGRGGGGGARLVGVVEAVLVSYDYDREAPTPFTADVIAALEAFEGRPLR